MSVEQILELLRSWTPNGAPMSASPEGLARSLAAAVGQDPERFADRAASFQGTDPTYARALVNGLEKALREKRTFPWGSVLTFGAWLVQQPVDPDDRNEQGALDRDRDFRAAKKALVSVIQVGLTLGEAGILPINERQRVWALIHEVAQDANPSPGYENRWGGDNMDPATLALNTVRPSAIRTAIKYAIWVNSHVNGLREPIRMDGVPELRDLLERCLDPTIDLSAAVRAAIGYELGQLTWLDENWLRANRERLFPEGEHALSLRLALFDTFLKYGWDSPSVVRVIPEEYEAAILRAGVDRGTRHIGDHPDECLAHRLMTLYWRGEIPLQGDPGLMLLFFSQVPGELKKRAIHFVGWSLFNSEKPVEAEPLDRLRDLWEWRSAALHKGIADGGNGAARKELVEFGWWFASRAFNSAWALPHLQAILRLEGTVEWDHEVVAHLAELADQRPRDVLDTLALFDPTARGEIWKVQYWLEHARTILRRCMADQDSGVREDATRLINRWVARGHLELRDLL